MEEIINKLPEPMQLNQSLFIVAAIFLALVILLNYFIFKPLVSVMEERQRRIAAGAEAQSKSVQTVEERMAAYREALIEARRKAQGRRQQILKESEMGRSEIIAASKEKAMAMVQAAATDIETQVGAAKTTLTRDTRDLAQKIVASVLARASS